MYPRFFVLDLLGLENSNIHKLFTIKKLTNRKEYDIIYTEKMKGRKK